MVNKSFHPGIYIKMNLEVQAMSSKEMSLRTGISEKVLSEIINGKCNLTFETAYKIAKFYGTSVELRMNLQTAYDIYIKEEKEKEEKKQELKYIQNLKSFLVQNNFVYSTAEDIDMLEKSKQLAGVNYLESLKEKNILALFRKGKETDEGSIFLQNFWVAMSLTEARKKMNNEFDFDKFVRSLDRLREITKYEQDVFYPELCKILDDAGVIFVYLPYLEGSNIYGVTKWLNSTHVMIAMANESGLAYDFWLTLFHEFAHIINRKKRVSLYYSKEEQEAEAECFGRDILMPYDSWCDFIERGDFSAKAINEFASKLSILPDIIYGRLKKEKPKLVNAKELDKVYNKTYSIKVEIIQK